MAANAFCNAAIKDAADNAATAKTAKITTNVFVSLLSSRYHSLRRILSIDVFKVTLLTMF